MTGKEIVFCRKCGRNYPTVEAFAKHKCRPVEADRPEGRFIRFCQTCGANFPTQEKFEEHLDGHKKGTLKPKAKRRKKQAPKEEQAPLITTAAADTQFSGPPPKQ